MSAGAVDMNITFLSPLTPTDLKRQSLPFSYVNVAVSSADGKPHDVELYTDITAEWASGDRLTVAEWEYGVTPAPSTRRSRHRRQSNSTSAGIAYHKFYRQTQLLFSEVAEQSEYGNWYWATDNVDSLTHQSGSDVQVRSAFRNTGALANTNDNNFRAINDSYPTFGFAVGLGKVGSAPVSTLFTLGHAQEQAIQFDGANGNVSLPALWTSYYATELDALSFFHNDYATAAGLASTFDNKVAGDSAAAGGQNYVTMTSLAARQAFGATQLAGTPDAPYLFLKEISSDGNIQTVDVIFPGHPIFLYTNPTLLKLLLDPLFINQESGQYPNQYSMHDLGSHYPNATGHSAGNDEPQPLEECGNMLIMTLAYAQRASDTAYLSQHYKILNQWTQYLIEEALIPANQISTDDFAGALANQTNLALKGIIGIEAMAVIANLTGNTADATNYTTIAHDYVTKWQSLGIAQDANPPHTTLAYGMNDTHNNLYNLYGDKELNLGLVPQYVYDIQSAFYPTIIEEYGVPLDTRHDFAKPDEQMLAAATCSASTAGLYIGAISKWINETPTNRAMTDLYNAMGGDYPNADLHFTARPTVGGYFSILALPS
ncbi:MAG: hypothetical protein HETSPECPRED_002085 [Heterodermia speciosa]|uniref:DUF1793-domain-containing protein n=1 Tax=Heterodermia speciosa TaxID=116794 RepID=A0A8H3J379_9LECA|nr:MAG: hypothetical protein HETSPECPRED_002085 [Heterodermia speciosa]